MQWSGILQLQLPAFDLYQVFLKQSANISIFVLKHFLHKVCCIKGNDYIQLAVCNISYLCLNLIELLISILKFYAFFALNNLLVFHQLLMLQSPFSYSLIMCYAVVVQEELCNIGRVDVYYYHALLKFF